MSDASAQDSPSVADSPGRPPKATRGRGPNGLGVLALALSLASAVVLVAAMVTAGVLFNKDLDEVYSGQASLGDIISRAEGNAGTLGWRAAIGVMMAAGLGMAALGTASGVWGLFRRGRRKAAAIAGVIVGGFFLSCLLAAWLVLLARR